MNINNIILISVCVILIIYYYNLNTENDNIESFQQENNNQISLSEYLQDNKQITVYENGLITKGLPFACSVIPHSKYFDHSYCGKDYNKDQKNIIFPVHIIINYKGNYLALFNDGLIRKKKSITDNFWNNPLNNSVANQPTSNFGSNHEIVPMRMITFDGNNSLIGVGFDNKLYIKVDRSNLAADDPERMMSKETTYENRWQLIQSSLLNEGIIYILYKQFNIGVSVDRNNSNDIALVLNTSGELFYYSYNDENLNSELIKVPTNNNLAFIKIYFDQYGYLLGLTDEFKLYRSKEKVYYDTTYKDDNSSEDSSPSQTEDNIFPSEINFDESSSNPTPLLDIIYDYDARLFGLGIFPARNRTIFMKQKNKCINCFFLSEFAFSHEVPDFYSNPDSNKRKLNKEDILKLKSGFDLGITQLKKMPELTDINVAYQKSKLNAKQKLRKYCADFTNKKKSDNVNFELVNRLEEQEKKIADLNKSIAEMIKFDPEKKKIQDDIGLHTF